MTLIEELMLAMTIVRDFGPRWSVILLCPESHVPVVIQMESYRTTAFDYNSVPCPPRKRVVCPLYKVQVVMDQIEREKEVEPY